ncbi:SRPBCC domain-containing protein [Actinophytocola sp. NPDC049390]|uniref:SRPBCC domain-containing protein n=1 Tax=Actinophytocola sp. NPDC049390 TaxID=3363894 RepID=UPI0037AABA06
MKILARTVAPAADARALLPYATVTDDGLIEAEVRDREFTQRCLEISNAVDELEGRPVLRYDETSTTVDIAAAPSAVFASLTERELFARWFGLPLAIEPHPGGRWEIEGGGPVGTVVEVVADRRLVLSEDTGVSTWELSEVDAGTRLSVSMSLRGGPPPPRSWCGWLSGVNQLRRFHEVPERCPIWVT